MKTKFVFLTVIILSLISCRNNNYTPSEPESQIAPNINSNIIIQPEKGDIYYVGDEIFIEYHSFSSADKIDIYGEKKGNIIYTIAKGVPNTGKYTWKTTDDIPTSNHYQIRLQHPGNPDIYVLSERFGLIIK